MSGSSSSWGLGRAAVCDCGTPWTFLLLFFVRRYFVRDFFRGKNREQYIGRDFDILSFSLLCRGCIPKYLKRVFFGNFARSKRGLVYLGVLKIYRNNIYGKVCIRENLYSGNNQEQNIGRY